MPRALSRFCARYKTVGHRPDASTHTRRAGSSWSSSSGPLAAQLSQHCWCVKSRLPRFAHNGDYLLDPPRSWSPALPGPRFERRPSVPTTSPQGVIVPKNLADWPSRADRPAAACDPAAAPHGRCRVWAHARGWAAQRRLFHWLIPVAVGPNVSPTAIRVVDPWWCDRRRRSLAYLQPVSGCSPPAGADARICADS
jgi:hypothetical protein